MLILSIETSCDETAVSLIQASTSGKFKVLGNELFSQAKLHEEFGGVFPNLARREHQKNLTPLFLKVLNSLNSKPQTINHKQSLNIQKKLKTKAQKLEAILHREPELLQDFEQHIFKLKKPKIDRIAVTVGPGLEPALWVGVSFAKALGALWDIPVVPVNHMRGHALSVLINGKEKSKFQISNFNGNKIQFPALALLISGGHTELVLMKSYTSYKVVGQTLDDAAGEAYDKVARILGLPYPGGPEIAKLAEQFRNKSQIKNNNLQIKLPRPMIHTKDLNFSFSGLKTAVLYLVRDLLKSDILNLKSVRSEIAHEFEESVKDVLVHKTRKALEQYKIKTLIVGGGVSANTYIKEHLKNLAEEKEVAYLPSSKELATDNAVMIAVAGFFAKPKPISKIKAEGNLSI
jgi:N6-L-threonylcarbamoyladenine synthase